MDAIRKKYFARCEFVQRLLGLWPWQPVWARMLIFTLLAGMQGLNSLTQMAMMLLEDITLVKWCRLTSAVLVSTVSTFKYLYEVFHELKKKAMLVTVKKDWDSLRVSEEIEILKKHADDGLRLFIFLSGCLTILYSITPIVPLVPKILDKLYPLNYTREYELPLVGNYVIDMDKYFYIILGHMILVLCVFVATVVAIDGLFIALIYHASGMFNIVGYRLADAFNSDDEYATEESLMEKKFHTAIETHQSVLEFADKLNSYYGVFWLIQLSLYILQNTLICIQTALYLGHWDKIIIQFIYLFCALTRLYFAFYAAQHLIDQSYTPFEKLQQSNWYKASPRVKKLMIVVFRRGLKPCCIDAQFYVLCLETFKWLIQVIVSYFMVLYSMQQ